MQTTTGDTVVWHEDGMAIIRTDRGFGSGFSVYRTTMPDQDGKVVGTKLNAPNNWFTTFEVAMAEVDRLREAS